MLFPRLQSAGKTASMTSLQSPKARRIANLFPFPPAWFIFICGVVRRNKRQYTHFGSLYFVLDKLYYSTQSACIVIKCGFFIKARHCLQLPHNTVTCDVLLLAVARGMLVRHKTIRYATFQRRLSSVNAFDSRWPGWQIVIGIEVHAQIKSRLKLFSGLLKVCGIHVHNNTLHNFIRFSHLTTRIQSKHACLCI
jgi:hypothetical protein